jgi:hypothetical protein
MKLTRRPPRRRSPGREPAAACDAAVIVTAARDGGRHVLMVRPAGDREWALPCRPVADGEDAAQTAVAALAGDAGLSVSPAACQPRPPRRMGNSAPWEEDGDLIAPVLVSMGNVARLPHLTAGGSVRDAAWIPAGDYPALLDALAARGAPARVAGPHTGLLNAFLGSPPVPSPSDNPGRLAAFIAQGYETGVLEFLVECRTPEAFAAAIAATPGHRGFRPADVARELGPLFSEFTYASVGREAGPVIYLHLPFYDDQRHKNDAAAAAAAADLRPRPDQGIRISPRETDALVRQAVSAGRRLRAREADGIEQPALGVCKVRLWWR